MTTAERAANLRIKTCFADALDYVQFYAIATDEDWENETTIAHFEDGSSVAICYPFITVWSAA